MGDEGAEKVDETERRFVLAGVRVRAGGALLPLDAEGVGDGGISAITSIGLFSSVTLWFVSGPFLIGRDK